jgi:hydrogenase maturation protease
MLKVIGLGNSLRGDDGIGSEVIKKLLTETNKANFELYDAGSDPFSILEQLLQSDPVLVIDSARMGLKPGNIRRISAKKSGFIESEFGLSLHGFNLADVWKMAQSMGVKNDLIIIGIEPEKIEFNTGLSPAVKKCIPIVVKMVEEEAEKYA